MSTNEQSKSPYEWVTSRSKKNYRPRAAYPSSVVIHEGAAITWCRSKGTVPSNRHPSSQAEEDCASPCQLALLQLLHKTGRWRNAQLWRSFAATFLAQHDRVTILKNLVIDHLISKAAEFHIPSGCTKKIHKNTNDSDQLRGLWLDFYVCGEIPGARFQAELQDGRVHPQFLKDLAVAQMARIAKTNGI